jgi:hypothetical protein
MAAYRAGTVPSLSPAEKKLVAGLTSRNLADYKAGTPAAATGWIGMLIIILVVEFILIGWEWHFSGRDVPARRLFRDLFHLR